MTYPGNKIHGWMTPRELQWLYEQAKRMRSIVEVGAWLGRSTHALLSGCPGPVIVVDNWRAQLDGMDMKAAYGAFRENLSGFDNLKVLRMNSLTAAKKLEDDHIEMVFLDASHDYESTMADLKAWTPRTLKVICGHDYSTTWPGVVQAVDEFFEGKARLAPGAIWFMEIG